MGVGIMSRRREEEKILDVNAAMQGSLVFSDPVNLRISGKFEGNLSTKGILTIGRNADVNADIKGETINIAGKVKGKIYASTRLKLDSTAQVAGEIEASVVSIEEGAVFNGKCKMSEGRITLEELSEYLSIEEEKIKELVGEGKIPAEKDGNKLLFVRREVEDWVAHNP